MNDKIKRLITEAIITKDMARAFADFQNALDKEIKAQSIDKGRAKAMHRDLANLVDRFLRAPLKESIDIPGYDGVDESIVRLNEAMNIDTKE